MVIIRTFWGDMNSFGGKYQNQIQDTTDENLNEIVYVGNG